MKLVVKHVDDDIVVVDKPVGMVVHSAGSFSGPDVISELEKLGISITTTQAQTADAYRRGVVSRLDVGTSGLLVIARNDISFTSLKNQFMAHTVVKKYNALVEGKFSLMHGIISAPIGRHPKNRWKYTIVEGGKEARTSFDVVYEYQLPNKMGTVTYLELQLETGRTHQIRVHMQHYGHPLVGERVYKRNYSKADEYLQLHRPFLHSRFLEFIHPTLKTIVSFESELVQDLQEALQKL
ncbi:MAG: RluA family pseudouridine synthase [Candidatus Ancillula sp.]|jgi:23S rRNA pseudouridine1911/1915/1917 synthase|nr:RluA family pseudouridine synthase [Candidatus Ancillula sp.]